MPLQEVLDRGGHLAAFGAGLGELAGDILTGVT